MARTKTGAFVIEGVRTLIVRDLDGSESEKPLEISSKAKSTHFWDVLPDISGRSFASGDSGCRSEMKPGSDPILRDIQHFGHETISSLEIPARTDRFNRLAVIAATKTLGILRREMPP